LAQAAGVLTLVLGLIIVQRLLESRQPFPYLVVLLGVARPG
jgi:hypothetical protein